MKTSRLWLQRYFDQELPSPEKLADVLTFHAFEIEDVVDQILDVKITANRGHDCLCHRGIAKELSAILDVPMKRDPLREDVSLAPKTDAVSVSIKEPELCHRYIAGFMRGVKVGPSPEWLKNFLETIGQRSINNVVDATNFVMFDLGQPLHAFDAGKLVQRDGTYAIAVRKGKDGERLIALDDKEYELSSLDLVITDAHSDVGIGIAGVKGGAPAAINEDTRDIIIEAAQFDGPSVRKTAQRLKLRTDASARFEQVISPDVAAYGMRAVVDLILEIAGGELIGFVDEYPKHEQQKSVRVTAEKINNVLGTNVSEDTIAKTLERLDLEYTMLDGAFSVEPPFERLDFVIAEDVVEEVGRIIGYDAVAPVELPELAMKPEVNVNYFAAEKIRTELVGQGYSEVYTSVFADKGDRVIANKVDGVRPYLRANLTEGLKDALERNVRNKDLLGLRQVKLFEIGVVWKGGIEKTMVATAIEDKKSSKLEERELQPVDAAQYDVLPASRGERYQPFSKYPFITRDIALWVPEGTSADEVLEVIRSAAGDLVVRSSLFDEFKKEGRTSLAFRLVFQSFDKTLTDLDAAERMTSVEKAVQEKGWEVR